MAGLTVKINLRFQISLAYCGRDFSNILHHSSLFARVVATVRRFGYIKRDESNTN